MKRNVERMTKRHRRWISCFRRRSAGCERDWNLLKGRKLARQYVIHLLGTLPKEDCAQLTIPVRGYGKGIIALLVRIGSIAIGKGVRPIHLSQPANMCVATLPAKFA